MIRRPPRSTLFPLHDALPISPKAPYSAVQRSFRSMTLSSTKPSPRQTCIRMQVCRGDGLVELKVMLRKLLWTALYGAFGEIGRASCRGKSVDLGGRRIIKKKNSQ